MASSNDPIGTGVLCPFRRDGKGDFANGSGLELLKSDVGELLGLVGSSATEPGELPWDPDRGSRLPMMKHRHLHSIMVRALADQLSSGVLREYEPRVRPGEVRVTTEDESATLKVHVSYRPLGFVRAETQTVTTEIRR